MLTSKERADLRSKANRLSPIFSLGKDGISKEFAKGVDGALETRELVKINILQNCDIEPKDAANELSRATRSEVVQVIGGKFVLYRKSQKTAKAEEEAQRLKLAKEEEDKAKRRRRGRNFRR